MSVAILILLMLPFVDTSPYERCPILVGYIPGPCQCDKKLRSGRGSHHHEAHMLSFNSFRGSYQTGLGRRPSEERGVGIHLVSAEFFDIVR